MSLRQLQWMFCTLVIVGAEFCSVATAGEPLAVEINAADCTCRHSDGWSIAETANFSVWTPVRSRELSAVDIAVKCEQLRATILQRWELQFTAWDAMCVVVVHADRTAYLDAMGPAHVHSVGCTTITCDRGAIIFRRIDLRADIDQWDVNGLPHELSHVVVADVVQGRSIPVWLHEGLAMSSESLALRERRAELLTSATAAGHLPRLAELFNARATRDRERMEFDYAVSLALVQHLEDIGGSARLMEFTDRCSQTDLETAFREIYGHERLAQVEDAWLASRDYNSATRLSVEAAN